MLARKRSHFPRLEAALRDRGVPCEVVGLGGLLHEPEVVDVVSTLRVLADPTAGAALLRLLTGPRWRLGPRDLDALGRRARRLAVRPVGPVAGRAAGDGAGAPRRPTTGRARVRRRRRAQPGRRPRRPGRPGRLLRRRATAGSCRLRDELRRLRRLSADRRCPTW